MSLGSCVRFIHLIRVALVLSCSWCIDVMLRSRLVDVDYVNILLGITILRLRISKRLIVDS